MFCFFFCLGFVALFGPPSSIIHFLMEIKQKKKVIVLFIAKQTSDYIFPVRYYVMMEKRFADFHPYGERIQAGEEEVIM